MATRWLEDLFEPEEALPDAADDETRDLELSTEERRTLEIVETLEELGVL